MDTNKSQEDFYQVAVDSQASALSVLRPGVRAQEVTSAGFMQDDFHITETPQAIHVRNAPSPGATASLAISNGIVDTAAAAFNLN